MSKGKKKNKGNSGRINYKKANKAQSAAAKPAVQQNEVKQSTAPSSRYQETRAKGLVGDTGTLSFNAIDTLFFRESRPMESQGELQSVFPPPIRTLAGAVRTLIGEQAGVVWSEFNEAHPVSKVIGYGDNLGVLTLEGAWLTLSGERLFPSPLVLLNKENQLFQLA
jgi:CRISPR-associated protein Cmr3